MGFYFLGSRKVLSLLLKLDTDRHVALRTLRPSRKSHPSLVLPLQNLTGTNMRRMAGILLAELDGRERSLGSRAVAIVFLVACGPY